MQDEGTGLLGWIEQNYSGRGAEISGELVGMAGLGIATPQGAEAEAFGGAGFKVGGSGQLMIRGQTILLSLSGSAGWLLGGNLGASLGVGLEAEDKLSVTGTAKASWELSLKDHLSLSLDTCKALLTLTDKPEAAIETWIKSILTLIQRFAPTAVEFNGETKNEFGYTAEAEDGIKNVEGSLTNTTGGGFKYGYNSEGVYFEVYGSTQFAAIAKIGIGPVSIPSPDLVWERGFGLRITAPSSERFEKEGLAAANSYQLINMMGDSNCKSEDQLSKGSLVEILALLAGVGENVVSPETVPEQTLKRSFTLRAADPSIIIGGGIPIMTASAELELGYERILEGTVVVGPEAVKLALLGETSVDSAYSEAEAAMEVARSIAGRIIQPQYEIQADPLPDLGEGVAASKLEGVKETLKINEKLSAEGTLAMEAALKGSVEGKISAIQEKELPGMTIEQLKQYADSCQYI
jgi:hypothetical protein